MRDNYMITVYDNLGVAQVGVTLLIDEIDADKIEGMFGALRMVRVMQDGSRVKIEKLEDETEWEIYIINT